MTYVDMHHEASPEAPQLSRRAFLGGMIATAGTIAVGGSLFDTQPAAAEEQQLATPEQDATTPIGNDAVGAEESAHGFSAWYEDLTDPNQSYLTSAKQDLVARGLGVAASLPLQAVGIPIGNGNLSEIMNDPERLLALPSEARLATNITVVAPVTEELAFRALPSALLNFAMRRKSGYDTRSSQLAAGLVTSALFAEAHNVRTKKWYAPVPQFFSGLLFWRQARNAGVSHSMVAHATGNGLSTLFVMPKIKRKRAEAYEKLVNERLQTQRVIRPQHPLPVRQTPLQPAQKLRQVPIKRVQKDESWRELPWMKDK